MSSDLKGTYNEAIAVAVAFRDRVDLLRGGHEMELVGVGVAKARCVAT
jgi:hypothetical protein